MRSVTFILVCLLIVAYTADPRDQIKVPGYPANYPTKVYSGYLDVKNANRSLHYVFVESVKGEKNNDPVTLWLNGGPGCSSLLGFLQEIGPYYLEDGIKYHAGDNLTLNNYSWHTASNLLFLESPAGVGFSINNDTNYHHTDASTAMDSFNAVLDFMLNKFNEYRSNRFWIAGESYAGKYIPDLAVLLDGYNEGVTIDKRIDFRGIMVGNGVMSFENDDITRSQIEYMIDHSFVDPSLLNYWRSSCQFDWESAGCQFFQTRFGQNTDEINPYNVYGYCYYNDSFTTDKKFYRKSQQSILMEIIANSSKSKLKPKMNGAPCAYFDGISDYFNQHDVDFKSKVHKWSGPCADIQYQIEPAGSMAQYRYLMGRINKYVIALYNGDWDDVIPYRDTIENLRRLDLLPANQFLPWFTDNQHSGFTQYYSGFSFTTFKGASHQVPQTKRPASLEYFKSVLGSHTSPRQQLQKVEVKAE